ncbi:MAG: tetratricopeptide repeat protein [Desulfobacterales bacterium]|nr:tetratricopeptide repeat protein [Desulfobacterales bacterium]
MNYYEQGLLHIEQKDYSQGEIQLREALQHEKNHPHSEIVFHLAFCLEMQGHYEEAEMYYEQIELSEASLAIAGNTRFRMGWMSMISKNHVKALNYYKEALDLFEKDHHFTMIKECMYWIAISYESIDQVLKALAYYERIADDNDWFWDVCYRKIKCFDKIGAYEKVLACCLEFETRYQMKNDIDRAIKLLPDVLRIKRELITLMVE